MQNNIKKYIDFYSKNGIGYKFSLFLLEEYSKIKAPSYFWEKALNNDLLEDTTTEYATLIDIFCNEDKDFCKKILNDGYDEAQCILNDTVITTIENCVEDVEKYYGNTKKGNICKDVFNSMLGITTMQMKDVANKYNVEPPYITKLKVEFVTALSLNLLNPFPNSNLKIYTIKELKKHLIKFQ